MITINPAAETDRKEIASTRQTMDGVYFTRFDTYETEHEWIFRSPMPDVELVKVETKVEDGHLVIQGKVRMSQDTSPENLKTLCFYRSFPSVGKPAEDRISATFRNGVLTVCFPKARVSATTGESI